MQERRVPPSGGRSHGETYGRTTGSGNKRNSSLGRCGTRCLTQRREQRSRLSSVKREKTVTKPPGMAQPPGYLLKQQEKNLLVPFFSDFDRELSSMFSVGSQLNGFTGENPTVFRENVP